MLISSTRLQNIYPDKAWICAMSLVLLLSLISSHTKAQYTPSLQITLDSSEVFNGGNSDGHVTRGLIDLSLEASVPSIKGATLFVQGLVQKGDHGSELSGDIQGFSNIDSDNFEAIFEAWYGQSLLNDQLNIKLGWMDGNSDFAVTEHGGQFINSSMGFSPTIFAMPTYPETVLGFYVNKRVNQGNTIAFAVFDGEGNEKFEQSFVIGQYSHYINETHLSLGYWDYSAQTKAQGWYAMLEHKFNNGIGLFSQFGVADKSIAEIDQHLGFGIVKYAPFNRTQDNVGLGITQANVAARNKAETTVEAYYRYKLNKYVSLKPDIQYITNPSAGSRLSHPWIMTLRAVAQF